MLFDVFAFAGYGARRFVGVDHAPVAVNEVWCLGLVVPLGRVFFSGGQFAVVAEAAGVFSAAAVEWHAEH